LSAPGGKSGIIRCFLVNSDLFLLKFSGFVLLLLMAAFAGGAVYLAFWDIPPPSAEIVRQLPDDQFPR
jgi:hypothetical protein